MTEQPADTDLDGGTPAETEPPTVIDGGSPSSDLDPDDDTAEFTALYDDDSDDVPRAADGVQDDLTDEADR